MKYFIRIRAGALQFVLFIGTIIAILLLTFVLISYTHTYFHKKTDLTIDLIQEAQFGLLSSFTKRIPLNDSISAPSKINNTVFVTIKREFWGFFEKRYTNAKHGATQFSKVGLIGMRKNMNAPALYLSDRQRPMIIAGNAKITGDALLPEQGIRQGNIAGNPYHYNQLVFGNIQTSNSQLPKLDMEKITHISKWFTDESIYLNGPFTLKPTMKLKNSFKLPTKIINGKTMYLSEVSLIGNILISATEKIIVDATVNLRDVVLMAPEIVINNKVKGCFQAIASKHIQVGNKVALQYPSALVVLDHFNAPFKKSTVNNNGITIGTDTLIKGMVVYVNETAEANYFPQIKISSGALIQGEVYCNGNLELKGTVHGEVMTDAFISLENGSVYQNHLYNGIINSSLLVPEYVGLTKENTYQKGIMKWLY